MQHVSHEYVSIIVQANAAAHPSLTELLAEAATRERDAEKKSEWVFTPHLSEDEIKAGLDSGKLKKGTFRVDRDYWSEASVSQRGADAPIFIPGTTHGRTTHYWQCY
jgi:transposase